MPSEPFLGSIIPVGFNFAPRGYAFCQGQTMSIAQNTALFSLLGTTYGGNGQTTFALPDLRDVVPAHTGQGPGLSPLSLGERSTRVLANGNGSASVAVARDMLASSSSASVAAPLDDEPQLAINYVIALQGVFPARN
ncbi:MAG: tail fiber protein [Pseudomonadota bacterium]